MPELPRPGEHFGRYLIESELGRGGMGVVYVASDSVLKRRVALKVVNARHVDEADYLRRFTREAESMARIESPHIVSIHDFGELNSTPYLVSQYVNGGDLAHHLDRRGPMTPELAARVTSQVALGLAAAHRAGILHRDVKPSNVLLRTGISGDLEALLCDFGIAQGDDSAGLTDTGAVIGSWGYLPPERLSGAPAHPTSDIYAVGCLLWACLTGQAPYRGNALSIAAAHREAPVRQLSGDGAIITTVNAILRDTMAKDPRQRLADANELARRLAGVGQLAGAETVLRRPLPTTSRPAIETSGPGRSPRETRNETSTDAHGSTPTGPTLPVLILIAVATAAMVVGIGWVLLSLSK